MERRSAWFCCPAVRRFFGHIGAALSEAMIGRPFAALTNKVTAARTPSRSRSRHSPRWKRRRRGSTFRSPRFFGRREIAFGIEELEAAGLGRLAHCGWQHPAFAERIRSAAVDALLATFPPARVQVVDGDYDTLLDGLRASRLDLLFGVLRQAAWAADVSEQLLFETPQWSSHAWIIR